MSDGQRAYNGKAAEAPAAGGVHPVAVLVVDDEPGMRNFLSKALAPRCALVEVAESAESAEALRRRYHFDLLIVDIRLSGQSGIEWLQQLRDRDVHTDVIVMTAYADLDTAVGAVRAGVADFLLKPFRIEQMLASVERCLAQRETRRENFLLRRQVRASGLDGIIGQTPAIQAVCGLVQRIAPTAATLLIEGETGTGKELVARAVHGLSGRDGPFVPVNCGSITPELLESELFGHTKGAFTSAHASREGLFSFARGGTLFLDEIAEMTLPMQSKLLRVLEEKRVRPVGADRQIAVDTRVLAATNRRLEREVAAGRFREDLFFRLNVVSVTVPPLRERADDIPLLLEHFVRTLSAELGVPGVPFTHRDVEALRRYAWPGNVRELANVIERSLLLGKLPADVLAVDEAGADGSSTDDDPTPRLDWTLERVQREHMLRVLEHVGGNKSEAARRLGVSRKTLERKLKAWAGDGAGG